MQDSSCKTPRWLELKRQLNNLDNASFISQSEKDPNAVVIDVRTSKEFASGSFSKAINIDFFGDNFWEQIEALDPEKTYYVACRSGRRSIRVCTYLRNSGFKNLYNLDSGMKSMPEFAL